jgi:hypothetical protein
MRRQYEWDAPAKLFFWPAADGADEDAIYPTLWAALQAATEGDGDTAWIVTQAGDILSPKLIRALRDEVPSRRSRVSARSLFSWARAA